MSTVTVANLKGGTGKTTTAIHIAAGLANQSQGMTALVDADAQGSALSWSEAAGGLGFTVMGLPTKDVHRRVKDELAAFENVVIDTPPGDAATVRSALMAADAIVFPISPGLLDIDRIRPTLELFAETEPINPAPVWALLTRVRTNTKSARAARTIIEDELGFTTFAVEIPLREHYAGAFGLSVGEDLGNYSAVVTELRSGLSRVEREEVRS